MSDDGERMSKEEMRRAGKVLQEGMGKVAVAAASAKGETEKFSEQVQLRTRKEIKKGPKATGTAQTSDGQQYFLFGETRKRRFKKNGKEDKRARNRVRRAQRLAMGMTRKEHRAHCSREGTHG